MYLVFEYVDRNLLEILEENPNGLDVFKLILARKNKINYLSINNSYKLLSF